MDPFTSAVAWWGMLGVLLVNIGLTILAVVWKSADVKPSDATIIRLGSAMVALPVLAAVIPVFSLLLPVFMRPEQISGTMEAVIGCQVLALALVLMSFYGFRDYLHSFAAFDEEGLEKCSVWWGRRTMKWADVQKVTLYAVGAVALYDYNGKRIVFSAYWDGLKKLREAIVSSLTPDRIIRR